MSHRVRRVDAGEDSGFLPSDQVSTMTHVPAMSTEPPASARDESDEVRAILQSLSTEVLLLITPDGKVVGTRPDMGVDLLVPSGVGAMSRYVASIVHPEDLDVVLAFFAEARRSTVERVCFRALRPDGSLVDYEATVVDPGLHPMLPGTVLRVRPVVDGGEGQELDGAERFRVLSAGLSLGVLSADRRGSVVSCNEQVEQILSRARIELVGRGWEEAIHVEDRAEVRAVAEMAARHGVGQQAMFRVGTGLSPRWASITFVPVGVAPAHTGWIATLEDLTERQRARSARSHQSTHDVLTGLPNRVILEDRLRQSCVRMRRGSQSVTVLLLDLDDFEEVNRAHGRAAGDEVLATVARRLRQVVRDVDTVSRYGDDEFVVVCEALEAEQAVDLMGRLAAAIDEPIPFGAGEVRVGASIGVVTTREATADASDLLAAAGARMRRQKRSL